MTFVTFLVLILIATCSVAPHRVKRVTPATYWQIPKTSEVIWHEFAPDYPEEDAVRLLAELESQNKTRYLLNSEQIKEMSKLETNENNSTYHSLCSSEKKRVFPEFVEINNTSKFYVLNPKHKKLQFIETEVCVLPSSTPIPGDEGEACKHVVSPGLSASTKCVQETITRTIYLMSNDTPRKLMTEPIIINSCCSCFVVI